MRKKDHGVPQPLFVQRSPTVKPISHHIATSSGSPYAWTGRQLPGSRCNQSSLPRWIRWWKAADRRQTSLKERRLYASGCFSWPLLCTTKTFVSVTLVAGRFNENDVHTGDVGEGVGEGGAVTQIATVVLMPAQSESPRRDFDNIPTQSSIESSLQNVLRG